MMYFIQILILFSIYTLLAFSLNMVIGYIGLLSLAHAAFFGIGAYITTILILKLGLFFPFAVVTGMIISGIASIFISQASLRFKDDIFILVTLSFQIIFFSVLQNWTSITNGALGFPNIPRPTILGINTSDINFFLILCTILTLSIIFLGVLILNSPFGRILKAIREDEIATLSLGRNVRLIKIKIFFISAVIAALAGSLFAFLYQFIDPTSFGLNESIFIVAIVLIGGSGNLKGPIVGALLMTIMPEVLRFIDIPTPMAANIRQIIFGITLVILMRFRTQGIAGIYKFE